MWGKLAILGDVRAGRRTIPTRVGRTNHEKYDDSCFSDHPHACGENAPGEYIAADLHGPSPRVWGKLDCGFGLGDHIRTIPHACGENRGLRSELGACFGPSPRAWGKRARRQSWSVSTGRTIPTRVGKTRTTSRNPRTGPDHPHARGENLRRAAPPPSGVGPSPRAWGKRRLYRAASAALRTIPTRVGKTAVRVFLPDAPPGTIPTRVGKTPPAADRRVSPTDHPHARGGKPLPRGRRRTVLRTIPTRVGKTSRISLRCAAIADHPHARGENHIAYPVSDLQDGPSPRAWGKTFLLRGRAYRVSDHPHARGENSFDSSDYPKYYGPSPRAWGKRRGSCVARVGGRTIPTRVGKTCSSITPISSTADHPHARGENGEGPLEGDLPHRTIPTRVGKTARRVRAAGASPDHPHARGENCRPYRPAASRLGPSPRAWGKPGREQRGRNPPRTIPTRVGKTVRRLRAEHLRSDHPHARGEN